MAIRHSSTLTLLVIAAATLLYAPVQAANYCGRNFADSKKCHRRCPRGLNHECPSGERCFAAVPCSGASRPPSTHTGTSFHLANYCGTTFANSKKCATRCPRGLNHECPAGEKCYARVRCPINSKPSAPRPRPPRPPQRPTRNVVLESLKYAPIYYFDGKAKDNCVPDYATSRNNGRCRKGFHSATPTYVRHNTCRGYDVYTFYLWYGWQKKCIDLGVFSGGAHGQHDNDWEPVSVYVRHGRVQHVMYHQHSHHYTRKRGTFGRSGERPHVYVGKLAHGSYHIGCNGKCFLPWCRISPKTCWGGCGIWDDFRNPGPRIHHLHVMDLKPGKVIDGLKRKDESICLSPCGGQNFDLGRGKPVGTSGCWQNNASF